MISIKQKSKNCTVKQKNTPIKRKAFKVRIKKNKDSLWQVMDFLQKSNFLKDHNLPTTKTEAQVQSINNLIMTLNHSKDLNALLTMPRVS